MSEMSNRITSEEEAPLTSPSLLGMTVRELREHRNMSKASLAKAAQVEESVISRIESGKTRALHAQNLKSIADALQVKLSYLRDLAYGSPPVSADEILNNYTRVTEEGTRTSSKRQAYLELLDIVMHENDERIKQQASILLKQVANWVLNDPIDAEYQNIIARSPMPADWEEKAQQLIESRSLSNHSVMSPSRDSIQ